MTHQRILLTHFLFQFNYKQTLRHRRRKSLLMRHQNASLLTTITFIWLITVSRLWAVISTSTTTRRSIKKELKINVA